MATSGKEGGPYCLGFKNRIEIRKKAKPLAVIGKKIKALWGGGKGGEGM